SSRKRLARKSMTTPQTENELPEWEKRFDEEFPAFTGVGAPYPIFDPPNPNRDWIKQFIANELARAEEEKAQAVKAAEQQSKYFKGTRVLISTIVEYLEKGWEWEEVKKRFPALNRYTDALSPQPQTEREEHEQL